jgi:hypothetical protein
MRFMRALGILLVIFSAVAFAKDVNSLGIHEVSHVKFDSAVHIGDNVLPAGEYVVRHTMQGEEHVMVFQRSGDKQEFKVKCTLVKLEKSASHDAVVYHLNAANEKTVQELVFRGDSAKHVF